MAFNKINGDAVFRGSSVLICSLASPVAYDRRNSASIFADEVWYRFQIDSDNPIAPIVCQDSVRVWSAVTASPSESLNKIELLERNRTSSIPLQGIEIIHNSIFGDRELYLPAMTSVVIELNLSLSADCQMRLFQSDNSLGRVSTI
jgi:hypothetical protein